VGKASDEQPSASVTPAPYFLPMTALLKLPGYLPQLVGKTIAHNMLIFHQGGRFQLWQFYTDGTSYEFYGEGYISGVRGIGRTAIEDVSSSVRLSKADILLIPDRRKVRRER
jgi:hypothetical protein